jgi:hypothetical protein
LVTCRTDSLETPATGSMEVYPGVQGGLHGGVMLHIHVQVDEAPRLKPSSISTTYPSESVLLSPLAYQTSHVLTGCRGGRRLNDSGV